MIIVLLGAPGVGKGTQGALLSRRHGIPKISVGELIRAGDAAANPLLAEAANYSEQGELVPDEIVLSIIRERIAADDCAQGFILDGFPRTSAQAQGLDAMLKAEKKRVYVVLDFVLCEDDVHHRLGSRRFCGHCGATYHLVARPPRMYGLCDDCELPLSRRADDQPHLIKARLRDYTREVDFLRNYYRVAGVVRRIPANDPPETVARRIGSLLNPTSSRRWLQQSASAGVSGKYLDAARS